MVNYEPNSLDITLSHDESLLPGWSVLYDNSTSWSKSFPGENSTIVSIGVTTPSDAEAVETGWLKLIASIPGYEDTYFNANITVSQEFGVSISSIGNTELLGNVSQLVTIPITNTGNGPDTFELTYGGSWIQNTTTTLSFDAFETKELTFPISSGLVTPGSQSSVFLVVNSTKSYLTENPISKSVVLDFTVTGMKAVGTQSMVLSQGESETFSIAIVSLIDSDSTTSRVMVQKYQEK